MPRPGSHLSGILLIAKPTGWTSHDVVAKARAITGQLRIGHTGTLDPMATGLLVLCLGRATRLVEYMIAHDKRYEGEVVLGVTTDTDDAEGNVVERRDVPALDEPSLASLGARFSGAQRQVPPAYSAVKVHGQKAYAAARAGAPLDLQPRTVTVHSLLLAPIARDRLALRVHCSAGTYVRSLARDIGQTIGCGAHLAALRRTVVGRFTLDEAITLEQLDTLAHRGLLESALLPLDEGVTDRDAAIVTTPHGLQLASGAAIHVEAPVRAASVARVYTVDGAFVGLAGVDTLGQIQPLKVLIDRS